MTRFHGNVTIDGKDASEYDLSALRDRMSLVPQEVLLFGGSIRENIAYGKPGATDCRDRSRCAKGQCA